METIKKNPFNFQHPNLIQIGISVNGEEIPFNPLKLNFDEKLFVTAYNTLFSGTGKLHGNSGSIIKREDYSEGYTIIVADLTPFEISDNFDLKAAETLSIDLAFKSPLAATINVLVYAEYDNVIEIDSSSIDHEGTDTLCIFIALLALQNAYLLLCWPSLMKGFEHTFFTLWRYQCKGSKT